MYRILRLAPTVLAALAAVTYAAESRAATQGELHLVFFQQDTSVKADMDQMFTCLTSSSTFGSTWCAQFGLSGVTYEGSVVLAQQSPDPIILGGNLDALMVAAMDNGLVPRPKQGIANEYLVYAPAGVGMQDSEGTVMCGGTGVCAEHGPSDYHGLQYDLALVPSSCDECGQGLDAASIGGEHEAAEGLADQGTAQYEVGDGCETQQNLTQLQCCGQQYDIQQLAGSGGEYDCQTIDPTGNACGCNVENVPCSKSTHCCSGLVCDSMTHVCAKAPPPEPDAGPANDGGADAGGSSSSSGGRGGGGSSGSSGGFTSPDSGVDESDGGNGDVPFGSGQRAGCACTNAGSASRSPLVGFAAIALPALAIVARRRRRSG